MGIYTLSNLWLDDGGAGAEIGGFVESRYSAGIQRLVAKAGGTVDSAFMAVQGGDMSMAFTTIDLRTILSLDTLGFLRTGHVLNAAEIGEFYWQQLDPQGEREGAASHMQFLVNLGLIVPRTLTATHGAAPATLACDVPTIWDGTNDPVTVAKNQNLRTFAKVSYVYGLGRVDVNGTDFDDDLASMTLDPGLTLEPVGGGGEPFNRFTGIMSRDPVITLTLHSAEAIADFGEMGTAVTSGEIFLRRYEKGKRAYADAAEQHIKIAFYEGHVAVDEGGVGHGAHAQPTLTITLNKDATHEVLVPTVDQAIT